MRQTTNRQKLEVNQEVGNRQQLPAVRLIGYVTWKWMLGLMISFLPLIVSAQVPGYLGKKTLLTADASLFPGFLYAQSTDVPIRLNTRVALVLDQVVSRKSSMGLAGGYYHTQYLYTSNNGMGNAEINGYSAAWNVKFYSFKRKGNIAPVGPYQQIELMYMRYQVRDLDRNFYPDRRENLGSYGDVAAGLTFGLRHIMFNRLTLHVGMQYAFVFGAFRSGDAQQRSIQSLSINRLQGHFGLNYNTGLGLLLF